MALIVEDGTGIANADAYISVEDAATYHDAMGTTLWATISPTEQEQAIRRATAYMVQNYRARWKGVRVSGSQALDWPRHDVEVDDITLGRIPYVLPYTEVPKQVKDACAELAFEAAQGALAGNLTQQKLSESVGPLSVTYDRSSPQWTRYRRVDMLLSPLLCRGGGASMRLVRA